MLAQSEELQNEDGQADETPAIERILREVAVKDATAIAELWSRLKNPLWERAEASMYSTFRIFDQDDIIAIVFAKLVVWIGDGNWHVDEDHLHRQVNTMVHRTVVSVYRYESRLKRGGGNQLCAQTNIGDIADEGRHEQQVEFTDEVLAFANGLNHRDREIFFARLRGHDRKEISELVKCSVRTVERRLAYLRDRVHHHFLCDQ